MKLFISHSGERSRALADELFTFFKKLMPTTVDPWISTGIDKGALWEKEIAENLQAASVGISCLTRDNLDNRWLLFEAGALARQLNGKVCTVLLDLEHADVKPPLSKFEHTKAERDEIWKLVVSINNSIKLASETAFELEFLKDHFTKLLWPELQQKIDALRALPAARPPERSEKELLAEVLDTVRELSRRPNTTGIQDKTLQLVKELYRANIGSDPPSLRALRQMAESPALRARVEESLRVSDPIRTGTVELILPPEREPS